MIPEPRRIFDLLEHLGQRPPEQVVFSSVCKGQWRDFTVADYLVYSRCTALALIHHGVRKGDAVLSLTHNRAEFNFADMGILLTGAVHVPLYPAIDTEKLKKIIGETHPRILFVSNRSLLRKVRQAVPDDTLLIVSFDDTEGAVSYDAFLESSGADESVLADRKDRVLPGDPASIIYLSGGNTPLRGVVLSHASHVYNLLQYSKLHHFSGCRTSLSFLPLAHSFERMLNYGYQYLGMRIVYCEGVSALSGLLRKYRPDTLAVVPLVLERIIETVSTEMMKAKGLRGIAARTALKLAAAAEARPEGSYGVIPELLFRLAFKGFRSFMGGNIKVILCGGAALKKESLNLLWAAGIPTYEGYGLSEAGPVVSYNLRNRFSAGSLGRTMPGVEVTIAGDGEVLVRTGSLMSGYYGHSHPAADAGGWLHTGDLGKLDAAGFLFLTGIKKDIFKLSSGLYTDPRPAEEYLCASEAIANAWVYGHNRSFLSAIIRPAAIPGNSSLSDVSSQKEAIAAQVAAYNATCPKYEQILHWELSDAEWSAGNGLLNADGKLCRNALLEKYRPVLERFFN
jgi:long-chain acyl-CoA synthetase